MARDQALLKNAQLDLERYRTLLAQDSIAKQQVDTQEALVRQYEGTVKIDQAAIDNAKLQLTYSRVTAPIGGRVGLRQVDPGNIVHAGDANGLVVITQLQPITRRVHDSRGQPAAGAEAAARRRSGRGRGLGPRPARPKLATGTLAHRRQPDRHDDRHGQAQGAVRERRTARSSRTSSSTCACWSRRCADATLVPTAAIQRGAQGTFVYVVKDDKHGHGAPVKLGPVAGRDRGGRRAALAPGDVVVVDGADKLREGAKVELIDARRDRRAGGRRQERRREAPRRVSGRPAASSASKGGG